MLIYKDGDIKRQVVTLRDLGGERSGVAEWERVLVDVGAIRPNDSRLTRRKEDVRPENGGIRRGATAQGDDEDSDWD